MAFSRMVNGASVADPTTRAWLDTADESILEGWFMWASEVECVSVTVNGLSAPFTIAVGARPDVNEALAVDVPCHGFRIQSNILTLRPDEEVIVEFSNGHKSLLLSGGTSASILVDKACKYWGENVPRTVIVNFDKAVADARETRAWLGDPAQQSRTPKLPSVFFGNNSPIGHRDDLRVSPYQAHAYVRHVRDHPGYRTGRHLTASTSAEVRRYLLWSLRNFAANYERAPLPVGVADLGQLNQLRVGTGLTKGRANGVLQDLSLTEAQADYIDATRGRTLAESEDELADWLLSWLGSWGWGHRGLVLMTSQQRSFLQGFGDSDPEKSTLDAICRLNRFAQARLREHRALREAYAPIHHPYVRLGLLLHLLCDEWTHAGSSQLLPTNFLEFIALGGARLITSLQSGQSQAPTPVAFAGQPQPVVRVFGMLASRSGLGQNARNSVEALEIAGIATGISPISINDRSAVSSVASDEASRAAINLWHLNPDNLPEAVCTVAPKLHSSSYNIGFFAWELDRQPRAHQLAIDWVDEIWVPSEYCARSFASATDKPIIVMPHAVAVPCDVTPRPLQRRAVGLEEDHFVVHYSFDMHSWPQRKNPLGVLRAFQLAFPTDPDVRLLIKIRNGHNIGLVDSDLDHLGASVLELAESDSRILIDISERSYRDTMSLLLMADCHISLHRSEGFGYSLAESLCLGVPLICSDYSGSQDFCDQSNAWLVPVTERYLFEGEYYLAPPAARWGEPDVNAAADALRAVRAGGVHVAEKRNRGLALSSSFSMSTMSLRYNERISEILKLRLNVTDKPA